MKKKDEHNKDDYQSDILDLTRKILKGVQLKEVGWADKLKGQDRINFLKFCSEVVANPFFEDLFNGLYMPHLIYGATKAENYDVLSFNRATANGVHFVKEFFEKYARQYTEEFETKESKVDPQKAFEPIDLELEDKFFKI